jgi:hypothetical protein
LVFRHIHEGKISELQIRESDVSSKFVVVRVYVQYIGQFLCEFRLYAIKFLATVFAGILRYPRKWVHVFATTLAHWQQSSTCKSGLWDPLIRENIRKNYSIPTPTQLNNHLLVKTLSVHAHFAKFSCTCAAQPGPNKHGRIALWIPFHQEPMLDKLP